MKDLSKKVSYGIYILLCVVLMSSCDNRKADQEMVDLMTENAYLEGYRAALKMQDIDSVWVEVSKRYKFK